jgi:hypothetical protein
MSTALKVDDYFLSAENASATADQRDIEALALKVYEMPAVQKAKAMAAMRWKGTMSSEVAADNWSRFDAFMEEWNYNHVLKAVNSDANYPKVLGHVFGPAHEWFGMKVPGSRAGGGDSPDNNYVIMPIDAQARYEIHCQAFEPLLADGAFVVTGDASLATTLGYLDWQDVKRDSDGRFVVTIDPQPAWVGNEGRANHIQSKLEARYLFLREVRSDWRQTTMALRIKRLDPPVAPPITLEQMADRAAYFILSEIAPVYFLIIKTMQGIPFNTFRPPFNSGAIGGLSSQTMCMGRVAIADDEAYVVTVTNAGAAYRSLVVMEADWLCTMEFWQHSNTANVAQTVTNADGSVTYVIAKTDPGVHNWLDTNGFNRVAAFHRWQGLPKTPVASGPPTLKGELVKLKDLDRVLPKETKRVTPAERKLLLAERLEGFKRRYAI